MSGTDSYVYAHARGESRCTHRYTCHRKFAITTMHIYSELISRYYAFKGVTYVNVSGTPSIHVEYVNRW